MDIICAKCGKHFYSIEAAREHSGHCKETSKSKELHWVPAKKAEFTQAEWDALLKLLNPPHTSTPNITRPNMEQMGIVPETSVHSSGPKNPEPSTSFTENKKRNDKIFTVTTRNLLISFILIFALSCVGLAINLWIGSPVPFWLLFGFSLIFSVEKWFFISPESIKLLEYHIDYS